MTTDVPIFALGTVLFPEGSLSLRVFEPRYVDMISECMRQSQPFGVACIQTGSEVGKAPSIHPVATYARIVDFDRLDDGLLGITAIGEQRFQVSNTRVQPDQLLIAEAVTPLAADEVLKIPSKLTHLCQIAKEIFKVSGQTLSPQQPLHAGWVANRIAEVLPLDSEVKQALLEIVDPMQRLQEVNTIVLEVAAQDQS